MGWWSNGEVHSLVKEMTLHDSVLPFVALTVSGQAEQR